ncbi:NAD(P)-dependent oxidoreductase, partial [Mesorhizobium sp. B1-1-5]|uniref:NAD(P)-dependent oxidoreductase n=1 Tax=Mesorhizobium sp. B1-1-5 TaxID=2589979 RepID=UPI0024849E37
DAETMRAAGIEKADDLQAMLRACDFVSIHCVLNDSTRGLIGKDTIARMKPGVIFVNTARGPLVDYDALYEALVSGQIASAMLETFAVEPVPSDWPLLQLPNVTLTPHIAGASVRTVTYAAEQAAEEVRRYIAGLPPVNPC